MAKIPELNNGWLNLNIYVTESNGKPAIQFRKTTTNKEFIKKIIQEAINGKPISAKIVLNNPMHAMIKLREKGII